MADNDLLPYPVPEDGGERLPISMGLTEWHYLVLYSDRMCAVSRLSQSVVWTESISTTGNPGGASSTGKYIGNMRGMCQDEATGVFWIFSDRALYQLSMQNEDRDVWELYLRSGKYDAALDHCKDAAQRDKVLTARADYYYEQKQFELAATFYAKSERSFEEVTLKFVNRKERDALKTFLQKKLENLKEKELPQKTLIVTWLTEIFLDRLNALPPHSPQAEMVLDEFRQFLSDNKDILNPHTTFNLISSHGRMEEAVYFASVIEDYERVVSHSLHHHNWKTALDVLSRQKKSRTVLQIFAVVDAPRTLRNSERMDPCFNNA
eukprot:TRINITY_DN2841_c0_g1_i5.p1 TRINITY_DN2841_c0_g1~~TRINITY_DN2841_c0_g1_i5.p1  ORF type:complete len:321 (+),score=76.13 TRINITY_DN2841_c0_g1_i5:943-1905(+)